MRSTVSRGLAVALTLVMIGSVFAIAAGPAGASGVPTIELEDPGDDTEAPASVDLVVSDVETHEVGAFQVDVSVNENVSLTVSETDRFNIESEEDDGTTTIVGYTGKTDESDSKLLAEIEADGEEGDVGEIQIDEVTTLADTNGEDIAHNVNTNPVSFTVGEASGNGGGGGGGGGGPSAPEPDDSVPSAAISIDPNPATVGETVTFSGADSTDDNRDIIGYEWVIDGQTESGETVTKVFDSAGTYDVELTVTNSVLGTDTVTATVTVEDGPADDDDDIQEPTDDEGDRDEPTDDDDGADDTIPGFGMTVAIVAFLSVALLALRRQQ